LTNLLTLDQYFIFGSLISLVIITYSDFKTLKIDDRRNWFMQGYVLVLALMSNIILFYIIYSLLILGMNKILKWWEKLTDQTVFGDGDKKLLQWLVPGFAVVHIGLPPVFFLALMVVLVGLAVYKHFQKDSEKQPGVLYITIAFLLTWGVSLI